ncbi:MAG TPA: YetF domain-containing protein [Miltoncostaeaceae bacterium]|nr:YetF domain-containing protein [Miltoncostaeaceae bacterium]
MDIVLRAATVFVLLLIVTRTIGRRELGQMEPFDLILLVVMGDLIQQGVTQSDYSLTGTALAVCTLAVLTVAVSYLSFRVRRLRPVLDGEPIVLIHDGRPIDANLRRERITVEELQAQARLQQLASLDDVSFAVLETGGRISFIPRRAE